MFLSDRHLIVVLDSRTFNPKDASRKFISNENGVKNRPK